MLVFSSACNWAGRAAGPADTSTEQVAAGGAELVKASISIGAGELEIGPGASGLLDASFHYSRNLGRPIARYEVNDRIGRLRVESADTGGSISGKRVNEWRLKFNEGIPLEFEVHVGAGESRLNLSALTVRRVGVRVGAGEATLVLGHPDRDVEVEVTGGVGEATVRLPADQSAVASAAGGLGSIEVKSMEARDGQYYSRGYDPAKPTWHIRVRGGVGTIRLEATE
jgi:hypothetical protein